MSSIAKKDSYRQGKLYNLLKPKIQLVGKVVFVGCIYA